MVPLPERPTNPESINRAKRDAAAGGWGGGCDFSSSSLLSSPEKSGPKSYEPERRHAITNTVSTSLSQYTATRRNAYLCLGPAIATLPTSRNSSRQGQGGRARFRGGLSCGAICLLLYCSQALRRVIQKATRLKDGKRYTLITWTANRCPDNLKDGKTIPP